MRARSPLENMRGSLVSCSKRVEKAEDLRAAKFHDLDLCQGHALVGPDCHSDISDGASERKHPQNLKSQDCLECSGLAEGGPVFPTKG